jgi:hypothetical protein
MPILPFARAPRVADGIIRANDEALVVTPLFRIADADPQGLELRFGLRLGCRGHPIERLHSPFKCAYEIFYHRLKLGLGRRREIFRNVDFADRISQIGAGVCDRALPAVALLRRALKRFAVEAKAQVVERFWEKTSALVERVESHPIPPGLERLAADQGGESFDRSRLPDDEGGLLIESGCAEVGLPIESRRFG